MPWEPGKSGNPNGYKGPRDRARREVFEKIKGLGHLDAIEILSTIANDQNAELGYRVAASSALVPYCHPKLGLGDAFIWQNVKKPPARYARCAPARQRTSGLLMGRAGRFKPGARYRRAVQG